MQPVTVKIINSGHQQLPAYATDAAAGMDVRADIAEPITLEPLDRVLVPTGLRVELPAGYEMQVRPRSGLALRHGLSLVNTPGTIDADYRGEIGIIVINLSRTSYTLNPGERIAQLVVARVEHVEWLPVEVIDDSERGEGGFGHTGTR